MIWLVGRLGHVEPERENGLPMLTGWRLAAIQNVSACGEDAGWRKTLRCTCKVDSPYGHALTSPEKICTVIQQKSVQNATSNSITSVTCVGAARVATSANS